MNATFDGARIHQQALDHEIDALRAERLINQRAGYRPGRVARGLASVGRGLVSVGTVLASRVETPAGQSADVGGHA